MRGGRSIAALAAAVCVGTWGASAAFAQDQVPQPVETLASGPLWQAAQQSLASASKARGLVVTPALARWARSLEAKPDLLLVVDRSLEAIGQFRFGTGPADAAFVYDAVAASRGSTTRVVLASLVGAGVQAPDLGAAALRLYPGSAGLEALLAAATSPAQGRVGRALLTAYGLAGRAGANYVAAHPEDTALIEALAAQVSTRGAALTLWDGLRTSGTQTAFLAAWPYAAPPGSAAMLTTAKPYPKERLLVDRYQSLSPSLSQQAVDVLARELDRVVDRYGVSRTPSGIPVALMEATLSVDPHGYLARSIQAYDRIRRAPWFGLARCGGNYHCWPYAYGPAQYDPAREIALWPGFLRAYRRAPGADDAAYRLGRSEELSGDLAAAVRTFYLATAMPVGDVAQASAVREVWVLDTEMTTADLRRMLAAPLPRTLRLQVRYSLGVDLLRQGRYSVAASVLDGVADAVGTQSLVLATPYVGGWPFAAAVRIQAAQARSLAALSAEAARAPTAAARAWAEYEVAAYMDHRTLLFYNQLWAGQLGAMPWLDYQPFTPTASFVAFESGENNYVQAGLRFLALSQQPDAPASLRGRALFSYGMCLYALESYNTGVSALWPQATLRAAIARTFATFAARYPQSALAPDALTLKAAFTSSRVVLRELVTRYGTSAAASDARGDLASQSWPAEPPAAQGTMPWRIIWTTTAGVPSGVRSWAAAPGAVVEWRYAGGDTYIRVRPRRVPAGQYPVLVDVTQVAPGAATVMWTLGPAAVGDAQPLILTRGYALVEVAGRVRITSASHVNYGVLPVGSDTLY